MSTSALSYHCKLPFVMGNSSVHHTARDGSGSHGWLVGVWLKQPVQWKGLCGETDPQASMADGGGKPEVEVLQASGL